MMKIPILLITFNRPEHTKQVLNTVLAAHPQDLYVFQDGARKDNIRDTKNCGEVRRVIDSLIKDIPIRLHTYYSDINLGCGPGPAAAISWFFKHEEMGIILEDDAVPHSDFFFYCEDLLLRFKENDSVRAIGSMKIAEEKKYGDGSYYFSMMNRNLCAWATWRRAWQSFDISLVNTSRKEISKALKYYGCGIIERSYWCDRLDEVHKDLCDGKSWDMQFLMSIWLNRGKGIIPNVNLSSNIGTVGEATHVLGTGNLIENLPTSSILPLTHPSSEHIQSDADRHFHFCYFEPNKKDWPFRKTVFYLINKKVKRLVGHNGPWIKKRHDEH